MEYHTATCPSHEFEKQSVEVDLNNSDDGIQHSELMGLRSLPIDRYSKNQKTQRFGNWI
jgi:hypothetical protein